MRLILIALLFAANVAAQSVFDVARTGTLNAAKTLHHKDPNIFNTVNDRGFTPLILACYRGNSEVAEYIIRTGANVNASSEMGTALMAASVKGSNDIAKLLLENKADPNIEDGGGNTALLYAVQFRNADLVRLLLKYKADKAHKDKKGKTAFEYAAFSGNEEIINLLK